jgi:hypothetical protein
MANWQKALDRSLNWVDDNTRGNSIKSVASQVCAVTCYWVIIRIVVVVVDWLKGVQFSGVLNVTHTHE